MTWIIWGRRSIRNDAVLRVFPIEAPTVVYIEGRPPLTEFD
ncbi:hypothetical protein [uncultured Sphingomonas sp.]|nr:hypothetical protein [uncultured Sphingomonas sp.]